MIDIPRQQFCFYLVRPRGGIEKSENKREDECERKITPREQAQGREDRDYYRKPQDRRERQREKQRDAGRKGKNQKEQFFVSRRVIPPRRLAARGGIILQTYSRPRQINLWRGRYYLHIPDLNVWPVASW